MGSRMRRHSSSICHRSRLSQFGGFDMYLQDRAGAGTRTARAGAEHAPCKGAEDTHSLAGVHPNGLQDSPELKLVVDRVPSAVHGVLGERLLHGDRVVARAGIHHDFFYQGRILRVVARPMHPSA